jgi:hypothetical protein
MTKKKVVLSGLYYPLAMLRYFEFALKRRDDVELFTVGPWFGSWIPWKGGINLPDKYAFPIDMPIPQSNNWINAGIILPQLPWEPDLWLQVDAGFCMQVPRGKFPVAIVGTDPHVLNYNQQRQICDHFFCMQTVYSKTGDQYLPYAYDPIWHAPLERIGSYEYDFCLVGLVYEHRQQLVDQLRARGYRVYCDTGPVYDQVRELYSKSRVGLNWSSLDDTNARAFELMAMGIPAVMNETTDMKSIFRRDNMPFMEFRDLGGALRACEELANANDAQMASLAAEQQLVVKPHTWDARIQTIFDVVGLS